MSDLRSVSMDVAFEIEQFLYREARLLDRFMLREWLDTMLAPDIRYQMVMAEELSRKNRDPDAAREVMACNDNRAALEMRVRQFESGVQGMLDPLPRMRRFITNVEACRHDNDGGYRVFSNGFATRSRRLYEHEQLAYGREDVLVRGEDGALRILSRRVDLDDRVIRSKHLLFFL